MITILSFGAGQDSTTILYRIVRDPVFRKAYVKGKLVVIMSDTGDEHDYTYRHVSYIEKFCKRHHIEFYFLRPKGGYHPNGCNGLIPWLKKNKCIMSKAFPKTCTDNLKIKPIYNFLDEYVGRNIYGRHIPFSKSKKGFLKCYAKQHGKIRVLIGISAEEKGRIAGEFTQSWMRKSLIRVYPLVETGMTRQDCQDWIKLAGLPLPPPSNCMRCPFMNEIELVWLYRTHPRAFWEWVDMERAKIKKSRSLGIPDKSNLGVHGKLLLPEALRMALKKHGSLTKKQLWEYKMSHGHCVQSKY
ncbi:hypothetical protein [Puia dinghuensis]|uniref:Phosphoadenosine phosphosulphate reductase domain-containing protein n=1 Tax=Puia dinghuensis TaxID=1792502 RepID=A0A8J2UB84_9BACT|nr:hypothetical protein [Puia dinghuensis]GGA92598.1 hypothetical protein GCM10011511_14970 [Puia dinghuensis]